MNAQLLRETIKNSGMSFKFVAEKSGMLRESLYNKLKGRGQFTVSEITGLSNVLHLTVSERERIFFRD